MRGRVFFISPRRRPHTKGLVKSLDFPTQLIFLIFLFLLQVLPAARDDAHDDVSS